MSASKINGSNETLCFRGVDEDFIDVIVESPKGLYIKRNPKVMGKHAEELVRGLVE